MRDLSGSSDKTDFPELLRQDAHAWLVLLTSGKATQEDAQAFQRWRALGPRHQKAFEEARDQWRLLKPAFGKLLGTRAELARHHQRLLQRSSLSRRVFLGAAVSAAAVAGVAVVHPPLGLWTPLDEWNADYRTAAGEQRSVALTSQVDVTMNTRTSVRQVAAEGRTVGLILLAGEAAVDVRAAERAFGVVAGKGRSLCEGGKFEVRFLDGKACVTCIEGAVRVEHPAGSLSLRVGQQASYDDASIGAPVAVDPADAAAWRRGELVFKRSPLSAVIDEINRYRPGRVVLMAPSLRHKTLSARLQFKALDAALLQIQRSFDLSARSLPGGVLILS
jgi:transmembrane sensor